ncbi:MAG: YaeQ family protein, partial [Pseudomonadales bacterium]|nr:YaeQ family protein [Pseudomonadales bacterium]
RLAEKVKIYSFNTKSDIWWQKEQEKFSALNVEIYQFDWEQVKQLSVLAERTMTLSMTISEQSIFVTADSGDCEVSWCQLTV